MWMPVVRLYIILFQCRFLLEYLMLAYFSNILVPNLFPYLIVRLHLHRCVTRG